jgi:ABC-type Zn uptake system ZnuABC Zn-binding protein ZnuA
LLDPVNAKLLAAQIASHLSQIDPSKASVFQSNLTRFNTTVDSKMADWQRQLAPYRGARIVTYHNDFLYLAQRFGLTVGGTLEPKPGIAPSPAQLAEIITTMRADNIRVILVQVYQNRRTAETVARQTGATVLDMTQQPGAIPNTATYFQLMDSLVRTLATGLQAGR